MTLHDLQMTLRIFLTAQHVRPTQVLQKSSTNHFSHSHRWGAIKSEHEKWGQNGWDMVTFGRDLLYLMLNISKSFQDKMTYLYTIMNRRFRRIILLLLEVIMTHVAPPVRENIKKILLKNEHCSDEQSSIYRREYQI